MNRQVLNGFIVYYNRVLLLIFDLRDCIIAIL